MNKLVVVVPLVLLASAYEKALDLFSPPASAPYAVARSVAFTGRPQAASQTVAAGVRGTTSTATVADVVTAANAFLATLTTAQQTSVVLTRSQTTAIRWSNLPCGANCRNGIQLSTLNATQLAAALAVVQAATGSTTNEGYSEALQIREAENALGGMYSPGLYFLAFLGTPSTTGTWQLQFGGHHLALNTTYKNGAVAGATPLFEGVEPLSFTVGSTGTIPAGTYAPLSSEKNAMAALLESLTTAQLAQARLTQTFSDVLLGPNGNGNFPATKVGLPVSSLTTAQQDLVVAAMAPWVQDADDVTAAALLATYRSQLATTYIAYSGNATLTNNADYVRLDGRDVWIEFVCQTGVVFPSQIHYHSIWRDHARDYGSDYYTTVASTKAAATAIFSVYPNPILDGNALHVKLTKAATNATYTLRNAMGQALTTNSFTGSVVDVPTTGLAAGTYVLSLEVEGMAPVTHRFLVK
ncbi:DUF3500 domain-containing protein [uncultured Hymenobacter sp.]|uniref:DUF3500 domain-containing protein n=1 Tax=uncultured Hymenobacter sp. TaxID=170016 RepID=UPI0035CB74E0